MMSSITQHRVYPIDIYQHVARRFNGVIGSQVLKMNTSRFQFRFQRHPNDNKSIIIGLFSKLIEAFQIIKKKYLFHQEKHHIRFKIKETPELHTITMYGGIYIPPQKVFKLLSLVLWYYIRYKSGSKPKLSNYGRKTTTQWRNEEKLLKREINNSPRILHLTYEEEPCHLCGKLTNALNKWTFRTQKDFTPIRLETRVCQKHRSKLI